MPTNLLLRGSRYSVRLFIPTDLRVHVGRNEVVRSLKTSNIKEAKVVLKGVQHIAEHLFFCARVGFVRRDTLLALLVQGIDIQPNGGTDYIRLHAGSVLKDACVPKTERRTVTLKQAVEEWMEQKKVKGLTDGTMKMYTINSRLALGFYGESYPVENLTNRELLRFVQDQQGRAIKNVSISRRIRLIKDLVTLACANHSLPLPSYKLELKDDSADVLPYSPGELNQMFTVMNRIRPGDFWKYWSLLIGLLGGLRREEVTSLKVDSICKEGDVWYFDVRDSKTDAGVRKAPITNTLVQQGFLDFVQERRRSGEPYLLMCHLPGRKRGYVAVPPEKYSDFFRNSIRSKLDLTLLHGKKKDLHSLRHNFSDALKQGSVRPDIIDELCGHEHAPGTMRSIYDEKFGLETLAENLEKAKWYCDFSFLRTWQK